MVSLILLFVLVFNPHRLATALEFPSQISLRVGVLHAPPFAILEEGHFGVTYDGYQLELLRQLVEFAAQDGVELSFDMSPSPPNYGAALDLVANDCNATTADPNPAQACNQFDVIIGDYYVNPDRAIRVDFSHGFVPP